MLAVKLDILPIAFLLWVKTKTGFAYNHAFSRVNITINFTPCLLTNRASRKSSFKMNMLKKYLFLTIQGRFCSKWGAIYKESTLPIIRTKYLSNYFLQLSSEKLACHTWCPAAQRRWSRWTYPPLLESTLHLSSAITLKMYQNFNCSRDINFLVNLYILNCQLPEFLSILEVLIFWLVPYEKGLHYTYK